MASRTGIRRAIAITVCAGVTLCGAEDEEKPPGAAEATRSVIVHAAYPAPGTELASSSSSPPPHESVAQYLKALPHFASGTWLMTFPDKPEIRGAWETVYSFRNDSTVEAAVTLRFFSRAGQLLPMPIKGVSGRAADYTFIIPAQGARDVELDNTADPVWPDALSVSTGWAAVICDNPSVKGQAFFTDYRYKSDGSVESKLTNMVSLVSLLSPGAIIPLPPTAPYSLPFYNDGMVSAYAFANTKATPIVMRAKFYDQQGVYLGSIDKSLSAFGQISFSSTAELSELDGKKGTMRLEGDGVIPLGFRFDTGTFTTLIP